MAKQNTNPEFAVNDRVEGGYGEDHDCGIVDRVEGDQVTVRWESGVVTTQHESVLLHANQGSGRRGADE